MELKQDAVERLLQGDLQTEQQVKPPLEKKPSHYRNDTVAESKKVSKERGQQEGKDMSMFTAKDDR